MSTIDVDALLLEVGPDAPCGKDLEYDPAFQALEREAVGKPEVQYGSTITPAVPPDWKVVRRMAGDLIRRSRDLRLAIYLARANLALHGVPGLADGLVLIERLLDARWTCVHPQLDPADQDPTQRINSLAILADAALVRELKDATVVSMPGLGPLTIRLLDIANGELPPAPDKEKIAIESIERALADLDPSTLDTAVAALDRALAAIVNIEQILLRQVGSSQALSFDALIRPLRKAHAFLARQQRGQPAARTGGAGTTAAGAAGSDGAPQAVRAGAANTPAGEIASRDDVVRTLDRLLQYYQRHEPSSPVPILLTRAKRLVPMNFFEIMKDLAPGGVEQLAVIRGPDGSKQEEES